MPMQNYPLPRLLTLMVIVMAVLMTGCVRDKSVRELKAKWAPPPSTFINVDGMDVHMRDEGPRDDPTPIILLHGTSASLHTWQGWVGQLKGSAV